jgi:hypothetical protein
MMTVWQREIASDAPQGRISSPGVKDHRAVNTGFALAAPDQRFT